MSQNINLDPWLFPTQLIQASSLVTLAAGNANLYGSLPDMFDSFPSMQSLRLSYNNFSGFLPKSFSGSGIQNLWLNNQQFGLSGTIEVLSNMTQLNQVWLHKNQFTGPIPDISKCETLFDLQLHDNLLTGIVPATLMSSTALQNVSLDNNTMQGPLPVFGSNVKKATFDGTNSFCQTKPGPCDPQVNTLLEVAGALGYPILLAESWEGNNACDGWSFIVCDTQGKVITVNFENKHFTGIISPAFANLTSLKNLVLKNNNLTGSIPANLLTLQQLQVLDVSNNNLFGEIPKFPYTVKLITTGNVLIGTTPSSGGGGNATTPNGSPALASGGSSMSPGMVSGIVISVVTFIVVVLFVSIKCYGNKKHIVRAVDSENGCNGVPSDKTGLHLSEGGNVAISIEILRKVTNNFSEDNILGRGGFGVVYKGELHDGTRIAVKRMECVAVSTEGMNEFEAEIAFLAKVKHRHLVSLLGYCINGNERLLVYEYMPQGTLTQHLFNWREKGVPPLTWRQRITIALDVARGVEYLHGLAPQSFIHRDLKPSNILLGDDMRAKVADFGLVKHAPDANSVETRVAGTFGYLAPEYTATGRVTTRVDVYAFGVVLMQLLSGKKALDDTIPDERSLLVTWFRRFLIKKENIPKAIDETLKNHDEETMECIYKVAELAGHCTAHNPFQRPEMGYVVNILAPLVRNWKPTSHEEEEKYGIDRHMSLPQGLEWQANEDASDVEVFCLTSIPRSLSC
ncbi:receptor-like kinase TMK4 [Prunus yedoensis var. nudiflora]|uniref:Receptor-like kinase TMK4 n=1 Tax=Prunus yedoensis var. nudiflora TaxID=2094558 RepID=A0A314UHT2_PRUYE|nr:receptor-like kinase TMK4 [Prunus yedoensis var. nudiflora]